MCLPELTQGWFVRFVLASGNVSGPRSESGPCDRSSVLRACAGSGNTAIGSRAPIGRAWSCRNPFGRQASFDPDESCAAHFLRPGAATGGQASCGSPKTRSERKDSPDRQTARGRDGRFARTECCSAAGSDAQNITKLAPHFSSADGAVTRASRAGAGPLTRFDATGHCPACGGDGSVGVGVVRQRCIKELWFGAIQWPKMRQGAPH
jgi:hypothetical protein